MKTTAQMLVATTDGPIVHEDRRFSLGRSQSSLESTDAREIRDFFKGNCLTAGFSVQFARNPETGELVELFRKGRIAMRDVRQLIDEGFSEWTYSWAWAPSHFLVDDQVVAVGRKIDLTPLATTQAAVGLGRTLGIL